MNTTVTLGGQGRLVIPVEIRDALGLRAGDQLHLQLSGRRVVLQRPTDATVALRGLLADVPSSRSLVDELIAERHAAARSGE